MRLSETERDSLEGDTNKYVDRKILRQNQNLLPLLISVDIAIAIACIDC